MASRHQRRRRRRERARRQAERIKQQTEAKTKGQKPPTPGPHVPPTPSGSKPPTPQGKPGSGQPYTPQGNKPPKPVATPPKPGSKIKGHHAGSSDHGGARHRPFGGGKGKPIPRRAREESKRHNHASTPTSKQDTKGGWSQEKNSSKKDKPYTGPGVKEGASFQKGVTDKGSTKDIKNQITKLTVKAGADPENEKLQSKLKGERIRLAKSLLGNKKETKLRKADKSATGDTPTNTRRQALKDKLGDGFSTFYHTKDKSKTTPTGKQGNLANAKIDPNAKPVPTPGRTPRPGPPNRMTKPKPTQQGNTLGNVKTSGKPIATTGRKLGPPARKRPRAY